MQGDLSSRQSRATVDVPEQGDVEMIRLVLAAQPPDRTQSAYMAKAKAVPAPPDAAAVNAARPHAKAAVERRTVTGRVRDPQGRPLAAVHINVSPNPAWPNAPLDPVPLAASDRDGHFELANVPRIPLDIFFHKEGFQSHRLELPENRDQIDCTYPLAADPSSRQRPVVRGDDPLPEAERDRLAFIDLSRHANEPLGDGPGGQGNDLNRLARGIRNLDGLYFRVGDDMIHLAGTLAAQQPRKVEGIAIRSRGQTLHFLHAVQQVVAPGTEVGAYIIHYADGVTERIPIVYGRDVVNWWLWGRGFREVPSAGRVAWTGLNDSAELNQGLRIRLFATTWTNPHPEKELATLDMISAGTLCDPFLVAATLEKKEKDRQEK